MVSVVKNKTLIRKQYPDFNMEDKRKILYNQLSKDYELGDFDSFSSKLDDENKRKAFYDAVSKDYELGDFDSFVSKISNPSPNSLSTGGVGTQEEADSIFDANMRRFQEGKPIERVSVGKNDITQGSYQYKPEVQKRILENKPDMFKSKTVDMYGAHDKDKDVADLMNEGRLYEMQDARQRYLQRPITTFGESFEQGSEALYQGGKNLVGEVFNLATGSQRDYERARSQLDELVQSGYDLSNFDPKKALKDYKDRDFQRRYNEWQKEISTRKEERENMGFFESLLHRINDPSRPKSQYEETGNLADEVQLARSYTAIQDALQKTNGNVDEAYKLLGQESSKETWGDKISREARSELAKQRPTEGFSAWAGGMVPQMIGTGAGIAASLSPYTRWLSPWLGRANMALLTGSTSGMSMAEARDYGASEGDIWKTGIIDAAIEYGTEKLPFERYFGKIQNATKSIIGKSIANATVDNDAAQNELSDLLQRVGKEFGAGLFSKKNISEYLKDVGTEGVSEFMAEALQTISPIVYQNPEDYPTLMEILESGWEGAKGGLFMGAFLGAGSKYSAYRIHNQRRKSQGNVTFADTNIGVVEILDEKDGVTSVLDANGEVHDISSDEVRDRATISYNDFVNSSYQKEASDIEDAYEDGTLLETPYDKHNAKLAVDRAESALMNDAELSTIVTAGVDSPVETIMLLAENGYSDEQIQKAKDYYTAYHRMNGLTDALLENVDSQIESANREVDANTNFNEDTKESTIVPVTLRDGRQGYVISGTIVPGERGGIDIGNSDSYIVVRVDGKNLPMNPNKDLVSVGQITTPEALKEYNSTELKRKLIDNAIGEIDWNTATPNPKVGDSFEMNGAPVVVAGMNENGLVVVSAEEWQKAQGKKDYAFQTQSVVPVSAYKDWASAQLDAQEEAAPSNEREEPKQRGTVSTPVALAYLLEGGQNSIENLGYFLHGVAAAFPELENEIETIRGNIGERLGVSPDRFEEVAPREKAEMRQVIESKYGKEGASIFDELVANSTGYVPKVGAKMALRLEELKPIGQETLVQPEAAQEGAVEVNPVAETTESVSNEEVQQPQQQAPVIPTKEDGSIDFVAYGKDNTFKTLGEKYGEKMPNKVAVTAKAFADDLRKAQQKLNKAELDYDDAPIGREDKAEKALNKAREEFEAVKREADFWAEMDADVKKAQEQRESIVNPQIEAEISNEPMTADEFVAQQLANGNIVLSKEDYMRETGFGNREANDMNGGANKLLTSNGMTLSEAGDRLMEMDRENGTNFFDQTDSNAGRDSLISVLGSVKSRKDLNQYIAEKRKSQAKRESEGARSELESMIMSAYHMTLEEYATLEETILQNNPYEGVDLAQIDAIFAEAELERQKLNKEQYESGTITEGNQGQSELLSEERIDNSKGNQPSQAVRKTEGTGRNIEVEGRTSQESSSGNEVVSQIEQARAEVDANPTESQKEAGNYKKGHVKIDGYDITIENPKGGVRSGTDKNGKKWSITMNNDYGYIRGTEAVDGDHIDVFLSSFPTQGSVFVVDQSNEDGSFDESKVMYGFSSLEEARAAYLSNYEKGWESRIMAITEVSKDEFKKWINSSHRKTKAFSEYKSVKAEASQGYSIEASNVSRMEDIEARITEIENERIEIEGELENLGNSNPLASAELISQLDQLDREQSELEAEYSGLRSMNDESNAILEEEGSNLRFRGQQAKEEKRRKPLRERAKEWSKKLGVKVKIMESLKDVTNVSARRAIIMGETVTGWYEESTGEVCLYMPYLSSESEVDATYIHEVVAHKGLRGLLGDKFDEFCDEVWNMMSAADKAKFIKYPGVNGNTRAAADEYIAHLAETIDVADSSWSKFTELIKKFLKAIGLEPKMTYSDIANTIKRSYQRLAESGNAENVGGDGTRFRTLEEINQTFNEELQQQIDGTLPNGHIYQLGSPSAVLLSTGIADVPIELNSTRLEDKSKNFGHDYDLSELKDLAKAIHNPMAIFAYGDKNKAQNIIVEIQHEGKNFIVGLSIKPKIGGQILDINSIRNVFPKDNAEWLNWVSQGKLLYADKERIQDLINQQQTNLADVDYLDLDSIANIVKDFPNPTLPEEKTLFRTVYHGSGASFDKFDHSFMGTGEGNQSFGWGTYVTDVEGIGKQYASIYAKNSPLAANALRWIEENGTYEDFLAQGEGKRRNWAIRHAKDYLKELKNDGASEDVIKSYEQDLVDTENALSEEAYNRTKENMVASLNRNLYEVEIPDNDGTNYIAWDKMLPKDQAERIKDAVRNSDFFKDYEKEYGRLAEERLDSWTKTNGGRAYKLLGNFTHMDQGADKAISQLLSKAGFVGFIYPANYMSGGNDFGQNNYVIFDEKDLDIKEHTRFRVLNDKNGKKTLVGLHNISENKLRKAIKQGGLANPSVAVIDMDKQSHTDYGDITFVIPSSMIDKKTGKNVGTYLADAYTPVYPTVVKKMSDKGAKALTKALESVNEIFRSKVRTFFNSYLDSGTIYDALSYWYLSDIGKNPPILEAALPDGYTREEVKNVKAVNPEATIFAELSEEERRKVIDLYIEREGGKEKYENDLANRVEGWKKSIEDENALQMRKKFSQDKLNELEEYGYEYGKIANYYSYAIRLANASSKPSEIETFRNAYDEVVKNGLEEDFGNWLMAKEEELGVEEKLFAGYDNQGRAKYVPNTLENASKLMKKDGRAGATGLGGFNYFVAILAPVAKNTKQISAKKQNLSTQEEYDRFAKKWGDHYHKLALQLQPGADKWADYGYHRLHEIAPMANPKEYAKKEYGIELSDKFIKDLNDVKNAIRNDFPARYFETKFERPVYLNEFAAAVVPSDMSLDLYGQLQRMGIPMYEYERGNNEARMEAVDKVTIDNEGIRFRTLPSMKLRKLEEGEKCNVERVFTQQKMFNFSSGEKIESYEDVAYIFKSLEDEAIENTFVALIKDGKPTIVHLGMGTANQSTLDQQAVIVAIDRIKPDEVYMVHNHPSGNLKASRQDVVLLDSMKKAYGSIVKDGIIINLRSGRYSVFNEEGSYAESNPSTPSKEIPVKTYSFSKRVFDKDFDIQELINVRSADDANYYAEKHGLVAALTSSQRLGDRDKISLLVIDQSGKIVGNVFLNHTDVTPSNMTAISKDIAYYTSAMSGQVAIIFGRMNIKEAGHLNMVVQRVSAGSVKMFDAISVNKDGEYVSAANEGVMEEAVDYANNGTRFRIANQNQVQEEVDKFTSKYNGKEVVVLNSTVSDEELESLGLDVEDVREAIEKGTEGFYDPITDKIYIFADIADADVLEKTLFHENGHGIFRKKKKFVNEFNENSKDKFKKGREDIAKYYKEYERAEELFVRIFEQELASGDFKYLPKYLSEELWNEFNDILKDFGYDRQKESDRRRKGSVVRTETDRGSEKKADVRNSDIEPNQREERKEKGRSKEQAERIKNLFEKVADMGLDGVLGNEAYNSTMIKMYGVLPEESRKEVMDDAVSNYNGDYVPAMHDYLIKAKANIVDKVLGAIRSALRKAGFDVDINSSDVKYLLWRSKKPLDNRNVFDVAEDISKQYEFGVNGTRFSIKNFDPSDKRDALIKEYDAYLKTGKFNFIEAFQDRMYSVKVLMDKIVNATGKKVRDYEDAYTAENHLGSTNRPMQKKYLDKFYKPLLEEVDKLADKYGSEVVERYIYCKSGLERNEVLRQRDADEAYNSSKAELDEKLAKNEINQAQYNALLAQIDAQRQKTLSEDVDYSGIRGMLYNVKAQQINDDYESGKIDKATRDQQLAKLEANRKDELKDWKDFAEKQVAALEGKASTKELDALWNKINAATNETLRMDYESGMIDKETYDAEKNMMKYYVPLRNWDDTTAEEMYEYRSELVRPVSSNQKRAKGRESQADNPIATIGLMAQNAIVRGNRNKVKQKFYAFVANRKTSLATVRDVWYVKDAQGNWVAEYADTSSAKNSAEFEAIIDQFEEDMKLLEAQGKAFKGKLPMGMKFKASSRQKQSHVVPVMINGKEYAVYVNGNPRAAQAMNGETNSEAANEKWEWYDKIKRMYSAGLTSWNPDFIIPNMIRDGIHASTMTLLDAGPIAAAKFALNGPRAFAQVFAMISGKGKSLVNPKYQAYFEEFIANGGETGYTAINTLEDYKKEYDKLINKAKGVKASNWAKDGFSAIGGLIETANRIFEDVNRFNAYVSSRESGESIMRSVNAAKNITVNFNRKGAGFANNSVWGTVAGWMSKWILFFNPAVQGIEQLITKSKANPKRATATAATILSSGFLMPMINELLVAALGGDDEDDYWNQSDYKRRNNWMLYTGDGYVTIPLPPVLRELYGIGDVIYGSITGHITPERAVMDVARQAQSAVGFFNLIPEASQEPDMITYTKGFAPDLAAPFLDVLTNTNFMGRPIAKWTDYNKYDPEYERVYKGVSKQWVEASKFLNELGGNEGRRSDVWGNFINPAMMEHLITSYGGGIGKTINNLAGMAIDIAEGDTENLDPFRKSPIVPRFFTPVDEKSAVPGINRRYYDYDYRYNVAKKALKNYQEGVASKEHPEYQKYIDEMKENGEIRFMNYFKSMSKQIKDVQNRIKENPKNKKELEEKLIEMKAQVSVKCAEILK